MCKRPWGRQARYLNYAAVERCRGTDHVHVGCGGRPLPLGEGAPRGWVGRHITEGMGGRVSVLRAWGNYGEGEKKKLFLSLTEKLAILTAPEIYLTEGHGTHVMVCKTSHT